jgi:predicted dehydrogenase
MRDLLQAWPRPARPRPIVLIGAGAIVRTAHVPAYARLGFPVAGFYDVNLAQARATAAAVPSATVFPSLEAAAASPGAVFDVAVPGDQVVSILERLPRGAAVLIQKPMGPDLVAADRILACCRERGLVAAINFQLRFAPGMLALHDLVAHGDLGTIVDVDVRVVIEQPWQNWTFMVGAPRVEIVYHSIHYIDAIRWLVGEPRGVYCKTVGHPATPQLSDTRARSCSTTATCCAARWCSTTRTRPTPRHKASQIMVEA